QPSNRRQQGPQARPLPAPLLPAHPPRQPSVPHPQTPRGKATPSSRDRAPTPPRRRPPRTAAHTAALPTRTSPSRLTNALGCLLFRQVEEHFLERAGARRQLVQDDALVMGELADLYGVHTLDHEPAAVLFDF